jgi:Na+-translocating ferredoxin:NAD+ oxidoreductase RnfC subunit
MINGDSCMFIEKILVSMLSPSWDYRWQECTKCNSCELNCEVKRDKMNSISIKNNGPLYNKQIVMGAEPDKNNGFQGFKIFFPDCKKMQAFSEIAEQNLRDLGEDGNVSVKVSNAGSIGLVDFDLRTEPELAEQQKLAISIALIKAAARERE